MLQYRLIVFKIQFPKKKPLIEACAAADRGILCFSTTTVLYDWLDI